MSLNYTFRLGLRSLGRRKLQSSLSVLGIVMGVAAVITMLSIGGGAKREALEQIRVLGTDLLVIRNRIPSERVSPRGETAMFRGTDDPFPGDFPLTLETAERLKNRFPGLGTWSEAIGRTARLQSDEGRRVDTAVIGASAELLPVRRLVLERGRFLVSNDREQGRQVCVLGSALAPELFPGRDPLGLMVRMEGRWFTVVGLLAPLPFAGGQASIFGIRNLNEALFVPLETLPGLPTSPRVLSIDEIGVRLSPGREVATAARAGVRDALVALEPSPPAGRPSAGPFVSYPEELLDQAARTVRIFNLVMGGIAGISLLVGGIGIMNVMLLTVSERRREIGIRRALGARKSQIAEHFLAEAILLTTMGGVIGSFLGAISAGSIFYFAGWPTVVSPSVVFLSLIVSAVVGLAFGFYPAWKAAEMDPVDAIRKA